MPRRPRLVIPHVPHHVTQRGSRKSSVFFCDEDRLTYLRLLKTYADRYSTAILGYCLMENHVHHILVPACATSLANVLKATHMRYANVINGRLGWTGHLWQQRYFSAPLDDDYFWAAMRYVERNPVKANLVRHPSDYPWSSAKAHCERSHDPFLSDDPRWRKLIEQRQDWADWLAMDLAMDNEENQIKLLRERTMQDQPCGNDAFIAAIENQVGQPVLRPSRMRRA